MPLYVKPMFTGFGDQYGLIPGMFSIVFKIRLLMRMVTLLLFPEIKFLCLQDKAPNQQKPFQLKLPMAIRPALSFSSPNIFHQLRIFLWPFTSFQILQLIHAWTFNNSQCPWQSCKCWWGFILISMHCISTCISLSYFFFWKKTIKTSQQS